VSSSVLRSAFVAELLQAVNEAAAMASAATIDNFFICSFIIYYLTFRLNMDCGEQ
jgi:hypothetical protein